MAKIKKAPKETKRKSRIAELEEIRQVQAAQVITPAPRVLPPVVQNPGRVLVTKPSTSEGVVWLQISVVLRGGETKDLLVKCGKDTRGRYTVTIEPAQEPIKEIWRSIAFDVIALPSDTNVGLLVSDDYDLKILATKDNQETFSVKVDKSDPQVIIVINGSALGFR